MKLLITGATGFLGSWLVKKMVSYGHDVAILKRSFSNTYRINKYLQQIRSYDIDRCCLEQPFREYGKFDAIIHTATAYGRTEENVKEVIAANIQFPLSLLEIAALSGTDAFINTDTFINTDNLRHQYLFNYSLSKKQFLEWGKQFASRKKIRFINVRLEHMYGPQDDKSKFCTHIINSCLANVPEIQLTLGEQKRDFIYVEDVVSAYKILIDQAPKYQDYFLEYELGTGQSVSIRTFVEMVHMLTKSTTHLNFGALPYREHEFMDSYANTEKLQQMGWEPITRLATGINKIIAEEKAAK